MRILCIDDDADIRTIVELALGLDPGITVRTAASGRAAIASLAVTEWTPDAIVLDVIYDRQAFMQVQEKVG